jgi:hypothetical protein
MNIDEKRTCLLCGRTIRHNQEVAVMANVLLAHLECIPGVGR